jgi:hypothetical protein
MLAALLAAAAPGIRAAAPGPDAAALAAAEALHATACVGCHARRDDGDATRLYLRADRRVNTPAQLRAQIAYCNTELGAGLFPDDEEHLAMFLDRQYYHFGPR